MKCHCFANDFGSPKLFQPKLKIIIIILFEKFFSLVAAIFLVAMIIADVLFVF